MPRCLYSASLPLYQTLSCWKVVIQHPSIWASCREVFTRHLIRFIKRRHAEKFLFSIPVYGRHAETSLLGIPSASTLTTRSWVTTFQNDDCDSLSGRRSQYPFRTTATASQDDLIYIPSPWKAFIQGLSLYKQISSYKSFHCGFHLFIKCSFHGRCHFFSCFSRSMALAMLSNCS